jgi:hypothetical protein
MSTQPSPMAYVRGARVTAAARHKGARRSIISPWECINRLRGLPRAAAAKAAKVAGVPGLRGFTCCCA